jgi:hypothetical protein
MTRRIIGGPAGISTAPVTQNNSSYVLIAETMPTAGTKNAFSGMTNPVMIDGTTVVDFTDISQNYRDLRIVFDSMGHNTANGSGYRIMMTLNGDTNTSRYYTRADNRDTTWNVDNVNYFYFGYMYRPENTTWTGTGEMYIPGYSKTRGGWNQRTFWGFWSHMNQSAYLITYKFDYYNNAAADLPITRITFRTESDVGYRLRSKISLYGIGAV